MQLHRYQGTPDRPFPPAPDDWVSVPAQDHHARTRAAALVAHLPTSHYVDERGPGGALYRFFAFDSPLGRHVAAMQPPATSMLGAPPRTGTLGVADITDPQTQADAAQMNDALIAHGYKESDMPIYAAFQEDAGLTTDGFPGPQTMKELGDVLFAMHVEMANVPIYPWVSKPGTSGYDGINAPTLAEWTGNANAVPTPAPTPAPSGGQSTSEPVPQPTAACSSWTVDTSTAQASAIAQNISFHDSPVAWSDQGVYDTTIGGVAYRFVMWWENGLKAVASYRCATGAAQASVTGGSAVPAVLLGTLAVGGLVVAGLAAKHPILGMMRR